MPLWSIERLGKAVSIQFADDIQIEQMFGDLLDDFQWSVTSQVQGVLLDVMAEDGAWLIVDTKLRETRRVTTVGDLIYFLSDKIIFHLVDRIDQGHCVHAACVAKGDQAFIFPANSGCGKSSLVCWLVANGFDYVSDELVILVENTHILAIPRPIQIKQHGLKAITPLLRKNAAMVQGNLVNALSASALGGRCSTRDYWQLSGVIVPSYRSGADFSYQPLNSASLVMALMQCHVNARNFDSHGFQFMTRVARRTPAFSLEYGGFEQLPQQFGETIAGH